MKKSLLFISLVLISFGYVLAQKDYIAPYFSYGLGLGTSDIVIEDQRTSWSSDTNIYSYTRSNQGFSMGRGIKAGLMYGHHFSRYVGLELAVEYFRPRKKTTSESYYEEWIPIPSYNATITEERVFSLHAINVVPMVKMSGGYTYWNPYVKCGVILSTQLMQEINTEKVVCRYPGYIPLETRIKTFRYNPRFTAGGLATIGIEWMNDRFLNIFTEVQLQYLTYSPTKAKIVRARYQDASYLATLTEDEINVEFVDSFEEDNIYDPDESKQLKFSIPMSAITLCAGVRINLGE